MAKKGAQALPVELKKPWRQSVKGLPKRLGNNHGRMI